MRAKRIKINLNPTRDDERRVLEYLQCSQVSNTKAVVIAVMDYLERQEQLCENRSFLQEVKDTIRESVTGLSFPTADVQFQPQESPEQEDDAEPLSFLSQMTGGVT